MTHKNQCVKARHGGIAGIVSTHKNSVLMITYRKGDASIEVVRDMGNLYNQEKEYQAR